MIHAAIIPLVFVGLPAGYHTGVLEFYFAMKMVDGQMPYVDFPVGYPPLALVSFWLPALVFRTPLAYTRSFAIEMLLLDFLALVLIAALAVRLNLGVWKTLAVYTLFIAAVGPIVISRYDLLPAVLLLAAMYAFATGRNKSTWALLALGVAAKVYPIVVAPLLALHCLRRRRYRELVSGTATFLGVLLLVVLPWLAVDSRSLLDFIRPQAERGLHSESSYGTILLVSQLLKLTDLSASMSAAGGSWDLISPLADRLAAASPYICATLLLIVYALYARSRWRRQNTAPKTTSDRDSTLLMLHYSSVAILVFLLSNKVFSPQYLVWLCPLLPLLAGQWRSRLWLWLLFAAIGDITQYVFPHHYIEFELGKPYLVVLLFLRNLLLIGMTILLASMSARIIGRESPPTTGVEVEKPPVHDGTQGDREAKPDVSFSPFPCGKDNACQGR